MSSLTDIKINRLLINVLNLEESSPKISEELFPAIEENNIIKTFFLTHIIETREGRDTKSCKFIDLDAMVKTKITRYQEKRKDKEFITLSKELTESLFIIMKNSSSKSNGTFFIMDIEMNKEEYIVLIKLDPKDGLQVDLEKLTVKVLNNMLPDSNDRVHKSAIIRLNKNSEDGTDLYVMDKQQKKGETAKYFLETYLQAEELLNDKIITREVIKMTRFHMSELFPQVDSNFLASSIDKEFSDQSKVELVKSFKNILEEVTPKDTKDREIFINDSTDNFIKSYIKKNPDHQTSFVVERKDNVIVYKGEKNQFYFKYNKGVQKDIHVKEDEEGNTLIKINKSLNIKREL